MKLIKLMVAVFLLNGMATSVAQSDNKFKKYKSHELSVEMEYPASWRVSEEGNSVSLRKFIKDKNQVVYISFFIQKGLNPHNYSIKKWYQELESQLLAKGVKIPEMIISYTSLGGVPAVLRETNGSLGKNFTYYVAQNNSNILSVSFFLNETTNNEINKIISTIKFGG